MVANNVLWPAEHSELLRRLLDSGHSRAEAAVAINERFGASYTRNACIGRARRMDFNPQTHPRGGISSEERSAAAVKRKREKRWAANPSLKSRYERLQEMKKNREAFTARGTAKTSAAYRKHYPRLPANMTKGELRAMLTAAVQNTAAMGVS